MTIHSAFAFWESELKPCASRGLLRLLVLAGLLTSQWPNLNSQAVPLLDRFPAKEQTLDALFARFEGIANLAWFALNWMSEREHEAKHSQSGLACS